MTHVEGVNFESVSHAIERKLMLPQIYL